MLYQVKPLARQTLPTPAYRALRNLWHLRQGASDWLMAFMMGINFIAQGRRMPDVLLFYGLAPGDDLLCTAVLRELYKRRRPCTLMISNYPELFLGGDASHIRPAGDRYYIDGSTVSKYRQFARIWRRDFRQPFYHRDRDLAKRASRHIIAQMCARSGIKGQVLIRPYLALTDYEKAQGAWANGKIVIQSSGMAARHPMQNKQWYLERFQGVVDSLREEFDFVQVGSASDPLIDHTMDLRGVTSIRETAAILHHARLYVGAVGFLMHLARAVDCPAVIVYGGREAPWQSGYICNANLYSSVPCAPCWRWNECDFDRRCMKEIAVGDVTSAIQHMAAKPRNPLTVQSIDIA
jgi:hypothetical protein